MGYDFICLAAGCLNGGGQLKPSGGETTKQRLVTVENIYSSVGTRSPRESTCIERLYTDWLGGHDSDKVKAMLHTQYHAVEKLTNALAIKW